MIRRFSHPCLLALLGAAALFLMGCGGASSTADRDRDGKPRDEEPKDSKTKDGTAPTLGKADFTLTSSELGAEYQKNFGAIREKYKGKVIELSGVVRWIRRDRDHPDRVQLWLYGATRSPVDMVKCVALDPTPWKTVTPGQNVKIKGKSPDPEYDGQIALVDCGIVEATGPRSPSLNADQVAREYRTDPVGFTKKYDANSLILSGEIVRLESQDERLPFAVLKTAEGKPRVVCHFGDLTEKEKGQLKQGKKIQVLCESGNNVTKEEVNLVAYLLMEKTD
jgi:hypothetical protein